MMRIYKMKKIDILIWVFLVFSFVMIFYFVINLYNSFNKIEELEGKYTFVCPNGSIVNFTETSPKYLCDDITISNPFLKNNNVWGNNEWYLNIS